MERKEVPLTLEQLAPFDLDAFIHKATELNQRHALTFTTPFPKAPSRWRSGAIPHFRSTCEMREVPERKAQRS